MFGGTIGADGRADRFHGTVAAFVRLAVKKSSSHSALETKYVFERIIFVTSEVLKIVLLPLCIFWRNN